MAEKSFIWFQGKSVDRLTEDLIDAGEGARLEIHPVGDDKLHLVVIAPDRAAKDPIDDSHICPPVCS